MLKQLTLPALMLAGLAGCADDGYRHHRHRVVEERVETYPPGPVVERDVVVYDDRLEPPPARVEVVGVAPYHDAVWRRGYWERDRERRAWVWRRGYWR